jgi:hypothetical protein
LLESDKSPELIALLENAHPTVEFRDYDGLDGGTNFFAFILRVPLSVFANIEAKLELLEEKVKNKIHRILRDERGNFISHVTIKPETQLETFRHTHSPPRFWVPYHFKLFISHLGKDKTRAQKLSSTLRSFGISCFVAHEDIEPTEEWQSEIDKALFSMDALVAILSPNFGRSNWTDHEVGVAIGREKLVLSLMNGRNPYGLISKYQGLPVLGKMVGEVGRIVFKALTKNRSSSAQLLSCRVDQFELAEELKSANRKIELLEHSESIPTELLGRIKEKTRKTPRFLNDDPLRKRINSLLAKHGFATAEKFDASVFPDEDIPF